MRAIRSILLIVILVAGALTGAWALPRIAGPATYKTAVADIAMKLDVSRPSQRGVELYVPLADWGLRAQVFDAPLRVSAEPRRIDRSGVVATVTGNERTAIARLRSDLDAALRDLTIRTVALILIGGLLGGLLVALIWNAAGVRKRHLLLAPFAAVVIVAAITGALGVWGAATFQGERLDEPDYYASGVELERIIEQADSLRASSERYSDSVDNSLRAISGLLDDRRERPAATADTGANASQRRRLVLASDPHNNVLTLPALKRYAAGSTVILAGDYTINGSRVETPFLSYLAEVSKRVVAVSGNHDAPGIMRALERAHVTVLRNTDGVQEIDGFRVVGFEDPFEYAGGDFPDGIRAGMSASELEDGDELLRQAKERYWRWWKALPERPQVVVIHQELLGRDLARRIQAEDPNGAPVSILVGHTHRQRVDRYGPATVVNPGSIGAGGPFGISAQSVGLALLDYNGAANALGAVTLISQNPASGAAQARRVVTAQPDCDKSIVFCHQPNEKETIVDRPGISRTPSPTTTPIP